MVLRVAVDAPIDDIASFVEKRLGAIAVVKVDVDDGDLPEARLA